MQAKRHRIDGGEFGGLEELAVAAAGGQSMAPSAVRAGMVQ